jgi:hypothetical protein
MTLYRDTTDPELATKIALAEGENRDIDIHLQPGVGLVHAVRGNTGDAYDCLDPSGTVDRSVPVLLLFPQKASVLDDLKSTFANQFAVGSRPNGAFEIRGVPEGSYELIAPCTDPLTGRVLVGRALVEVRGGDPAVSLPIRPGVTLVGEFLMTGLGGEAVKPDSLSLTLSSLGRMPSSLVDDPNPIVIDPAGKFVAFNVPEERYTFRLGSLPPAAYVEDIRQFDKNTAAMQSVFDDGFEMNEQSGPIQIVINTQERHRCRRGSHSGRHACRERDCGSRAPGGAPPQRPALQNRDHRPRWRIHHARRPARTIHRVRVGEPLSNGLDEPEAP